MQGSWMLAHLIRRLDGGTTLGHRSRLFWDEVVLSIEESINQFKEGIKLLMDSQTCILPFEAVFDASVDYAIPRRRATIRTLYIDVRL